MIFFLTFLKKIKVLNLNCSIVLISLLLYRTGYAQTPTPRMIALAPHLAQVAVSAGAGSMLVGVSEYTSPDYAGDLPLIGNAFAVNWSLVGKLKPTLVLVWKSGTSIAIKTRLKALNIAIFESEPTTLSDIVKEAEALATVLHINTLNNNIPLNQLRQKLKQLEAIKQANIAKNSKPIAVFHPIWSKPLMTVGGKHVMSDAMHYCGLRNVFEDAQGLTPTVSLAQVLREQPKIMLIAHDKPSIPNVWNDVLNAFPTAYKPKVIIVNGDRFHQSGVSLIDETIALCKQIQEIKD